MRFDKLPFRGLRSAPRDLPKLTETMRLGLLLSLIVVSLCIISEVSKRQQLLLRISERIGDINGEMAALSDDSAGARRAPDPGLREEAQVLRALRWQTRALIDRGAHGRPTYALVSLEDREFRSSYLANAVNQREEAARRPADPALLARLDGYVSHYRGDREVLPAAEARPGAGLDLLGLELRSLEYLDLRPRSFSSDSLAAILILLCAAIGSVTVGLRSDQVTTLRDLSLGVASGVVVLFLIKGGQVVFVVEGAAEHASAFNPYSIALAGLIAGFFTDRAFDLLSSRAPIPDAEREAPERTAPDGVDRR